MADEQGAVAVELLANKSRRGRTRPVAFKEGGTAEHKQAKGLMGYIQRLSVGER